MLNFEQYRICAEAPEAPLAALPTGSSEAAMRFQIAVSYRRGEKTPRQQQHAHFVGTLKNAVGMMVTLAAGLQRQGETILGFRVEPT